MVKVETRTPESLAVRAASAYERVFSWTRSNGIEVEPAKTELLIMCGRRPVHPITLTLDGHACTTGQKAKYLGLWINKAGMQRLPVPFRPGSLNYKHEACRSPLRLIIIKNCNYKEITINSILTPSTFSSYSDSLCLWQVSSLLLLYPSIIDSFFHKTRGAKYWWWKFAILVVEITSDGEMSTIEAKGWHGHDCHDI